MGERALSAKTSKEPGRSSMNQSETMNEIFRDFGDKSCCN